MNRITLRGWEELGSSFNNSLLSLNLDLSWNNYITDDIACEYCSEIEKLTQLLCLSLNFDGCNISRDIDSILMDTQKKN